MARFGRGLICLTLTRERCERLQLPPMAAHNGTRTAPPSRSRSRPPKA
jgi:3,4-dihydroxy 2-butanone 4-phosphate synthase/GTP cyclohydrolase II